MIFSPRRRHAHAPRRRRERLRVARYAVARRAIVFYARYAPAAQDMRHVYSMPVITIIAYFQLRRYFRARE